MRVEWKVASTVDMRVATMAELLADSKALLWVASLDALMAASTARQRAA